MKRFVCKTVIHPSDIIFTKLLIEDWTVFWIPNVKPLQVLSLDHCSMIGVMRLWKITRKNILCLNSSTRVLSFIATIIYVAMGWELIQVLNTYPCLFKSHIYLIINKMNSCEQSLLNEKGRYLFMYMQLTPIQMRKSKEK